MDIPKIVLTEKKINLTVSKLKEIIKSNQSSMKI